MGIRHDFQIVHLSSLAPYENNARTHDGSQVAAIEASITEFGFTNPVLIDENYRLIAGHGRLSAAKNLNLSEIPAVVCSGYTDAQKKALVIADNKIAMHKGAGWDLDLLKSEIHVLDDLDFNLDLLGFEAGEIDEFLIGSNGDSDDGGKDDDVPDLTDDATLTQSGDIWMLGEHRLICGDSEDELVYDAVLAGKTANCCFTSPPYNGNTHLDYGKGENKKLYSNDSDNKSSPEYIKFCQKVINCIFRNVSGFLFWNVSYNANSRGEYLKIVSDFHDKLWETIVWKKQGMPVTSGLTRNFEFIFCFKNGKEKDHLGITNEINFNFWEISNMNAQEKDSHRACFPVALPEKGIALSTNRSDMVLDPFSGSGTTMIACEKLGRVFYGIELDPAYVDLSVKRWQEFTGMDAILEKTGETFNQLLEGLDNGKTNVL